MHKSIHIKDCGLSFSHKICFENFNFQIPYGSKIAIIGQNGTGKTTLLKMIAGIFEGFDGTIIKDSNIVIGYVPQSIENHANLSGGEGLILAITQALDQAPDILLLDEPTNHLDSKNRKILTRMLQNYHGTLIFISHDTQFLRNHAQTLWRIDQSKIHTFYGNYDDYIHEIKTKRQAITKKLKILNRQKKDVHQKLMKEQERAAKSKASGEKKIENRKWLKIVGDLKAMKAEKSQGKKLKNIDEDKSDLNNQLKNLRLPEIIIPKFSIKSFDNSKCALIQISNGSIGYDPNKPILSEINFSLYANQRMAISGDNGSGKSTLIKGILNKAGSPDEALAQSGDWHIIKRDDIGYLDQHYSTLTPDKTVLETISELVPNLPHTEIRRHLNDFLFRKNEEVNAIVGTLSGGEKARLSLAQIATKTPKLLILDEITNNLDLETKEHVAQVLKAYPGAMIVISHDTAFLQEIDINSWYNIKTT